MLEEGVYYDQFAMTRLFAMIIYVYVIYMHIYTFYVTVYIHDINIHVFKLYKTFLS